LSENGNPLKIYEEPLRTFDGLVHRIRDRADLGLAVAELHHIGHRHLTMWVAPRDPEARPRSLAGIEEFLAEPLLLSDVDALLEALA